MTLDTEEQNHILSHAIERNPYAIVITDAKGNIEYVNDRFIRLTGYSQDEAIGQDLIILSKEIPVEERERMRNIIDSGREWQGEFRNKKKNGEFYCERVFISPMRNHEGTIYPFHGNKRRYYRIQKHRNAAYAYGQLRPPLRIF